MRLGHCTPTWGGHSPACDRDGTFCSLPSTHDGPCKPHGGSGCQCGHPYHGDDLCQGTGATLDPEYGIPADEPCVCREYVR